MKRYILLFTFIFAAILNIQAQKDPCSGNPRPIEVQEANYPHNPCYKAVYVYTVLKENPDATINWRVVRSEMSEEPAEGWIIVDKNDHDAAGDAAGYEITINGKNYFAASIRAGKKAGVIKATVTDPACGTGTKVATLPVRPGELLVTLTEGACHETEKTFTATATPNKNKNSATGYLYHWEYPAEWINTADPSAKGSYTTADINTLTLIAVGNAVGTVSVEVVATYKGNQGNGVGNANCDFGLAEITTSPCEFEDPCPPGSADISGQTAAGSDMQIIYQGTTFSGANKTVKFEITSDEVIDEVIIDLIQANPESTPDPIAMTTVEGGYSTNFTASQSYISYTKNGTGSTNLTISFTLPADAYLEAYGILVRDVTGGGVETFFEDCNFLPLEPFAAELVSFTGLTTPSGVELKWTTASEKDNDRFEVQRSTDGKDFKTIGTVKGAGNSSVTLNYSFTDNSAAKGTNYYRLNMIEPNGKSEFSNVIAIESAITPSVVTLYPNPVTGNKLTLRMNESTTSTRDFIVSITDMNGRKVFEQQLATNGSSDINLPLDKMNITKGMYIVKIQSDNLLETQKLLVR